MRYVIIFIMIGLIGGSIFWFLDRASGSHSVKIAFGESTPDSITLHIVIMSGTANYDYPGGDTRYDYVWKEWLREHFQIEDSSGEAASIGYQTKSALFPNSRGEVGFLRAVLRPGEKYTVRGLSQGRGSDIFEGAIIAPSEPTPGRLLM